MKLPAPHRPLDADLTIRMPYQRAHIEPEILIWARTTRGFSVEEAANSIGVKPERLYEWERGEREPTVKQLRDVANAYKRSIGLFFLPETPSEDEIGEIRDFRRAPFFGAYEFSPSLRLELRLAQERRTEALELASQLGDTLPTFPFLATTQDDHTEIAADLRRGLRISIEDQFGWGGAYQAFHHWRASIERLGVLVFQTGGKRFFKVATQEMRGFSLAEVPLPIIVVNSSDAVTARCFTLMHELTHIALRSGGLCDLHESGIEAFCNKVAAAVLVPAAELENVVASERLGSGSWKDAELRWLANKFKVSWEAILLRLLAIGRTTQEFYDEWRRTHEPPEPGSGWLLPPTRAIMRNGRLLPRLAFDAHSRGYLTLNDLSTLLGENIQHIDNIANEVFDARYRT